MPGRYNGNGGADSDAATVTAEKGTAIAGSYAPNDWGLYDMYGNVQEWCLDYFMEDPSQFRGAVNTSATQAGHILRGATYQGTWHQLRAAWRSYWDDDYQGNHVGFRLACRAGL